MSYPYDYNPWDDNSPQGQQAALTGPASFQDSEYGAGYGGSTQDFRQPTAGNDYSTDQPANQREPPESDTKPNEQAPGLVSRLLRQYVPAAGPILNTMSKINLPFVDALVQHVNKNLLMSKMFYFFFYSAFGSLFPLMGVYFKQQGMNPGQVGILTGVRPLIEIFSAPLWHSLADRFNKSKALLLFSLVSWIVFTYSLCHIRPPASGCIAFNDTDYVIYTPYSANDLSNYELDSEPSAPSLDSTTGNELMDSRNFHESSEESKGAQEAKSREKRQVYGPRYNRLPYSVEQAFGDSYISSAENELNFDLETDFRDNLLMINGLPAASQQALPVLVSSHFGRENNPAPEQLPLSKRSRYKRNSALGNGMRKANKPEEEGEGQGEEEGEEGESGAKELSGSGDNGDEKVKKGHQEGAGEQDQEESQEGDSRQAESGENEAEAQDNADNKKIHGRAKHNQQPTTLSQSPRSSLQESTTGPTTNELTTGSGTGSPANKTKRIYTQRHKTPPTHIVGMSPITIQYAVNYNPEKHSQSVTPMFSTIVYKLDDIKEVFFLLLLLISLGEFFSAPALTIADSVTLSYLGDNTDLYGRQRMFGSLSWAITLLLVGMALDNATSIADHPCGPHLRERSYTVCFIIFSLLMTCAFFTATQFRFSNSSTSGKAQNGATQQTMLASTTTDSNKVVTTTTGDCVPGNIDELYASTQPRSIFNTAPPVNAPPPGAAQQREKKFEFLDNWKSAVFAQRTRELPQWLNVFCQFKNTMHLSYLFITWFLGCGVGLVFTFLFWHLQDVGGTPTLFGICSVINHVSEILAYLFSLNFIKRFGHTKVLSVGLGCNAIRFLYVAFLTNPYYALPFELVQGITHSTCFAACCSYMSRASKAELKTSTQGVMQGLYHGIGRASGALLGGYMINKIGSRATFGIYGLLSGCVLAGFLQVRKRCALKEPEEAEVKEVDDEREEAAAMGGLGAPQGVPSAIDYQW